MQQYMKPYKQALRLVVHTGLCLLFIVVGNPLTADALKPEQRNMFKDNIDYFNFDTGPTCDVGAGGLGADIATNKKAEEYAKIVMGVAKTMKLGRPGALVGLITATQESHFKNYANSGIPISMDITHDAVGNDHDSLGIMQQRITMGWSTISSNPSDKAAVQQLMTPAYAAQAFFGSPKGSNAPKALSKGLQNVDGWQNMAPAKAAQAVQISAFPDAYAAHIESANALLDKFWESTPEVPLIVPVTGGTAEPVVNADCSTDTAVASGDIIGMIKQYAHPQYHPPNFLIKRTAYAAAVKEAQNNGGYVGGGANPGIDCGGFVTLVMRNSGADPKYNENNSNTAGQLAYVKKHTEKYTEVSVANGTNSLQPGDIALRDGHTYFYTGKIPGFQHIGASASISTKGTSWRAPMSSGISDYRQYEWFRLKR